VIIDVLFTLRYIFSCGFSGPFSKHVKAHVCQTLFNLQERIDK